MDHYNGPIHFLSYSLSGAMEDTYTNPRIHTCTFWRPCQHPDSNGGLCGTIINCITVAAHFRDGHGLVDLRRKDRVICEWSGCSKKISRHNFVRHVREKHLRHRRP
ncbi:hypothetical protein V8B97DRAFT_1933475 [Scleroderma yunnanense]